MQKSLLARKSEENVDMQKTKGIWYLQKKKRKMKDSK